MRLFWITYRHIALAGALTGIVFALAVFTGVDTSSNPDLVEEIRAEYSESRRLIAEKLEDEEALARIRSRTTRGELLVRPLSSASVITIMASEPVEIPEDSQWLTTFENFVGVHVPSVFGPGVDPYDIRVIDLSDQETFVNAVYSEYGKVAWRDFWAPRDIYTVQFVDKHGNSALRACASEDTRHPFCHERSKHPGEYALCFRVVGYVTEPVAREVCMGL